MKTLVLGVVLAVVTVPAWAEAISPDGAALGDAVLGVTAPGGAAPGDALSGGAPSGDALSGDALSGDALSGDAPSGGAIFGGLVPERPPAKTAGEVDAALTSILDANYQTRLPHEPPAASAESSSQRRHRELRPGSPGLRPPRSYSVYGGGLAQIASLLLWIIVAVVVTVIVLQLVQTLRRRGNAVAEVAVPQAVAAAVAERAAMVARPLGDAEALAAQGHFAEAIHALLLCTIEELARSVTSELPQGYTSREIVDRVPMPDQARAALSALVAAVELCYFGTDVPGAAEYQACRARFRDFAAAFVGGAAA